MNKFNEQIRLNKLIARSGYCSRRKADDYIQKGQVKVNGKIIKELGFLSSINDIISVKGRKLTFETNKYYILNKPTNVVCTASDPQGRKTIVELITSKERLFTVGRLDRNTTGAILLTNDGNLSYKLTHPKFEIKKEYVVTLDKNLIKSDISALREGIKLEDGLIKFDSIFWPHQTKKNKISLQLHSGKNRVIRRVFEKLDYYVKSLDRVSFAGISRQNLKRGEYRPLTSTEIVFLKNL